MNENETTKTPAPEPGTPAPERMDPAIDVVVPNPRTNRILMAGVAGLAVALVLAGYFFLSRDRKPADERTVSSKGRSPDGRHGAAGHTDGGEHAPGHAGDGTRVDLSADVLANTPLEYEGVTDRP